MSLNGHAVLGAVTSLGELKIFFLEEKVQVQFLLFLHCLQKGNNLITQFTVVQKKQAEMS